eukprot:13455626-Ditylum_brightwellii.AAC.1
MERGTDWQACQFKTEYVDKAQQCNNLFAQDAPGEQHPFEDAMKKFLTSGPIPLVFGAFGKVNAEFLTLLFLESPSQEPLHNSAYTVCISSNLLNRQQPLLLNATQQPTHGPPMARPHGSPAVNDTSTRSGTSTVMPSAWIEIGEPPQPY